MAAKIDVNTLIGQTFGYLTILAYQGKDKNSLIKVKAKCCCGREKEYFLGNLKKKNHTTSCGCHKMETAGDAVRTHGLSGKNHLYGIWNAIKRRCENKNTEDYSRYGALGVRMCDLWLNNYKAFHDWCIANGWKRGMQVDKDIKAKELNIPAILYSPELCTITTSKENNNNRKDNVIVEYKGERQTVAQLVQKYGLNYHTFWCRYMVRGWDLERAITMPAKRINKKG